MDRQLIRRRFEETDPAMPWFALVHVATACVLFRFAFVFQCSYGDSIRHMAQRFLLNVWLLTVLIAAFVVWWLLRRRGRMPERAASGLLLASYGLVCRAWCDLLTFGFGDVAGLVYDGHSTLESHPSLRLRFLINAHEYGGLLAFATGMTIVALGLRRRATCPRRHCAPGT